MTALWRLPCGVQRQAGSIGGMTPLLALTVLALVGLAYDGGNAITAHRRAINIAEQAGRAGAQQLDIATLRRDGTYRLDHPAARRAAASYLDVASQHGQIQVGHDPIGDYVQVTVSWQTPAVFARLLGRSQFTGTGTALARNATASSRRKPVDPPPPPQSSPAARRIAGLLRAGAALVTIAALTVGLPIVLWRLAGWPLPHTLPAPGDLSGLLTRSITDEVIANVLVTLVWLWWLHFLACLAAEIAATLRGRSATRIPGGVLSQAVAARLVGAVLLLSPATNFLHPPAAAAASRPAVVAAATLQPASHEVTSRPATGATLASDVRHTTAADSELKRYVVRAKQPGQPRDTLWGIADRHLNDPFRWREIEQLNIGRPLPDPPGGTYTGGTTIYPDQQLLLPADATDLPSAPPRPAPAQPTPKPPPPTPPPSSTTPATPPTPSTNGGPASTPLPAQLPATRTPARHDGTGSVLPAVAALAGAGLLAAGVVAILARRRIIQQRARRPGRRIKLPTGVAAEVELGLRTVQQPDDAEFLDLALRSLGSTAGGAHLPDVQTVLLGLDWLQIQFTDPADPPPPPFEPAATADRWRLPRTVSIQDLANLAADTPPPLPALVTLGHTEHATVLINLETAGLVGITGSPALAKPVLDAMAIELATSTWGGYFELILVGFGEALQSLERVRHVATLEELLPGLERRWARARDLLADNPPLSLLAARLATPTPDSWAPTVVLCATPPSPAQIQRLATPVRERSGLPFAAVVPGDDPNIPWRIELGDDHADLAPVGLHVQPQHLNPQATRAVGTLLATVTDTSDVDPTSPPYDTLDHNSIRHPTPPSPPPDTTQQPDDDLAAPAPVEVRVLGPIEVHGIPRITRAKSMELIVYLALHPRGVDADRLWEALWPEKSLNRGTLHTTVSVARNRLGDTPDGTPYLPDARDGIYRLHPTIGLDWTRFQHLTQHAGEIEQEPIPQLRRALELVRGTPLQTAAPHAYEWAIVHHTEIETTIAETADQLARHYLDTDDPTSASWAARRGLLASPYDERLYRQLMVAQHHAGNPTGIDTILNELLHTLGADLDDPIDDLHPETITLYRQLRGKRSIIG